jgi:DNA-binding CsgD family transcriptional regulator
MPEDQAASLLAMHCLVRGQAPSDYMVMITIDEDLLEGVTSRARDLLQATRAIASSRHLSRRQQQVLDGVVANLANKEIAARLNISERTVKFHVSSLLTKFQVRGRVDLMRKAVSSLLPDSLSGAIPPAGFRILGRKPRRSAPQGRGMRQHSRKGDRVVWPPGGQISA